MSTTATKPYCEAFVAKHLYPFRQKEVNTPDSAQMTLIRTFIDKCMGCGGFHDDGDDYACQQQYNSDYNSDTEVITNLVQKN